MLQRFDFQFSNLEELKKTAADLRKKIFSVENSSSLVLLHGEMGIGKTEFVRQVLDSDEDLWGSITSPTYTLHHVYQSVTRNVVVHHFDFYRLKEKRELEDFDFFRLLAEKPNHLFVEWPKWDLTSEPFLEKLDRDVFQIQLVRKLDRSS